MNYEEMSDFEINKKVTKRLGIESYDDGKIVSAGIYRDGENFVSVVGVVDYCNNPSDAWPIIFENNISLRSMYIRDSDGRKIIEWECKHIQRDWPNNSFGWDDKNPLRAAMIVFLMMQESSQ